MLGALNMQDVLSEVFKKYTDCLEVYVDTKYDVRDLEPCYYLYSPKELDLPALLYKLQAIYELPIHVYYTHYMRANMLENKKLLWRKGKWYL